MFGRESAKTGDAANTKRNDDTKKRLIEIMEVGEVANVLGSF